MLCCSVAVWWRLRKSASETWFEFLSCLRIRSMHFPAKTTSNAADTTEENWQFVQRLIYNAPLVVSLRISFCQRGHRYVFYLSATIETEAKTWARVPQANEHQEWAQGLGSSPGQGPCALNGVVGSGWFPRIAAHRFPHSDALRRLFVQARAHHSQAFVRCERSLRVRLQHGSCHADDRYVSRDVAPINASKHVPPLKSRHRVGQATRPAYFDAVFQLAGLPEGRSNHAGGYHRGETIWRCRAAQPGQEGFQGTCTTLPLWSASWTPATGLPKAGRAGSALWRIETDVGSVSASMSPLASAVGLICIGGVSACSTDIEPSFLPSWALRAGLSRPVRSTPSMRSHATASREGVVWRCVDSWNAIRFIRGERTQSDNQFQRR